MKPFKELISWNPLNNISRSSNDSNDFSPVTSSYIYGRNWMRGRGGGLERDKPDQISTNISQPPSDKSTTIPRYANAHVRWLPLEAADDIKRVKRNRN
jgi:hypothetical protein